MPITLRVVPDDHDLAQRCVRGDQAAQRQLFERERRRVHAILYRLLGTNGPMEDLLQDAFLEIFRSLSSYRGEASIGTWIDRCTVRVAYRWLRGRRVFLELAHALSLNEPSAERRADAREGVRRLYEALNQLEAKQRMAFCLHVIDGMSVARVASSMDATAVATRVRIFRARRALTKRAARDPVLRELLWGGP